jgi:hypothetical protein
VTAVIHRALVAIAVSAVLSLLAGCSSDPTMGYSTESTFRKDVATVAIPIFDNTTLARDVEYDLTDALIKEVQTRTSYQIVGRGRADTELLGRITDVKLDQISKSRLTGLGEEVILSVTIDFEWKDLRADRTIVERRDFTGTALFVPSAPSGESMEIGRFAVVQQLARDIVAEMRSDW